MMIKRLKLMAAMLALSLTAAAQSKLTGTVTDQNDELRRGQPCADIALLHVADARRIHSLRRFEQP